MNSLCIYKLLSLFIIRGTIPGKIPNLVYHSSYYEYIFFKGTYHTQKVTICREDNHGNKILTCSFARGSRVRGCIFVIKRWNTNQEQAPVYVSKGVKKPCELEGGRYHVLVYDWEVGWREHGPAFNMSTVNIKSKSECIT